MLPYDRTLPYYIEPEKLPQNVRGYAYCHWWKKSKEKNITAVVLGHRTTIFVTKRNHFGFIIGGDFSQAYYSTMQEALYRALLIVSNKGEHPSTKSRQDSIKHINECMQDAKHSLDTLSYQLQKDFQRKRDSLQNAQWKVMKSGTVMCQYNKYILSVFSVKRNGETRYAYSINGEIHDDYYDTVEIARDKLITHFIISGRADE